VRTPEIEKLLQFADPHKARFRRADIGCSRSRPPINGTKKWHAREARLPGLLARSAKHFARSR
jgi:hypothetical protein